LFLAVSFQWVQVSLGVFYAPLFHRTLLTTYGSDYRPMVLIGLGCILALAAGIHFGVRLIRRVTPHHGTQERPITFLGWPLLVIIYVTTIALEGTLNRWSGEFGSLRQILVTATLVRYVFLFMILRRLSQPIYWLAFAALLIAEIALGLTGFFAGFREPLVFAALALIERFDRRDMRQWVALGGLAAVMLFASIFWMSVRTQYRSDFDTIDTFASSHRERFNRMEGLWSDFRKQESDDVLGSLDETVDRMWAVYYPALAIRRVPSVLPHTSGSILAAALTHIVTPRVLFPGKAELPSDSDMVRKYSGVMVAGRDQNTTIAFGYAAESYVDFGLPAMFVPVFFYGLMMGVAYAALLRGIWHREIAIALVTTTFWVGLFLFERSWATMLGYAMSMIVYLGIPFLILDRTVLVKFLRQNQAESEYVLQEWPEIAP
jgi:hypothetical protein